MASDAAPRPLSRARLCLVAVWIFGCALYYYARFTVAFVHENEHALRRVLPDAVFTILPGPSTR